MSRALTIVPTVLIMLFAPINHCIAGAPGLLTNDGAAPDQDLGRFWWSGLATLDLTPPLYALGDAGRIDFLGLDGARRSGWCAMPTGGANAAVLHLPDSMTASPVECIDGCAHFAFAWRQADGDATPAVDTRECSLYRATLDVCRLTEIICGAERVGCESIGLVGEGYGAGIALAVAALMPDKVSFVVAHQPICVSASRSLEDERIASDPIRRRVVVRSAARLSARSFAPYVATRVLLTRGTDDEYATPATVADLFEALPDSAFLWTLEGAGHCAMGDVPGWDAAWQGWAFYGAPPA